jgi:pectate lyase
MGGDWSFNSAYRNSNDFNFLMRPPDNSEERDGAGHRITACLSFKGNHDVVRLNAAKCELKDNAFATDRKFTEASFESLDEAALVGPRQADGSLPKVAFLRPKDPKLAAEAGYTAYRDKQPAAK